MTPSLIANAARQAGKDHNVVLEAVFLWLKALDDHGDLPWCIS